MEIKKITFWRALIDVLIFQLLLQAFVWFVTIRELLSDYYSSTNLGSGLDLQYLMDQSHFGIFTNSNAARNLMRFFFVFTILFIFFRYFRKVGVILLKKSLYSLLLLISGFIIFVILDLVIYNYLIGNPFDFHIMW